ncbi:hypothetical protein RRG08_043188 [Elysia crispata]|uniref:Uncharacterized protein n=1 Tax=Elysia crispata TaxID=231223 RepID=A0AAE1DGS8_9GAST|nr:hypothetical protein RRG08_043188 [Elysia crispata]
MALVPHLTTGSVKLRIPYHQPCLCPSSFSVNPSDYRPMALFDTTLERREQTDINCPPCGREDRVSWSTRQGDKVSASVTPAGPGNPRGTNKVETVPSALTS